MNRWNLQSIFDVRDVPISPDGWWSPAAHNTGEKNCFKDAGEDYQSVEDI